MKQRGKFLNKEYWFSICSIHSVHDENCKLCTKGHWVKAWRYKISSVVFDNAPNLWIWWVNKKWKK